MGRESLELSGEAQSAVRTPKALPPQYAHPCQATASLSSFYRELVRSVLISLQPVPLPSRVQVHGWKIQKKEVHRMSLTTACNYV